MLKMGIEEFIKNVLGIEYYGISAKGWTRGALCPIHGETRSSFGIQVVYPYLVKCFSCMQHGVSLATFTARHLGISKDRAVALINDKLDIKFDLSKVFQREERLPVVPTVIAEMLERSLARSMAHKYLKYRGVSLWAARMFGLGYDDLNKSLTSPMINVNTGKVQGYSLVSFFGSFSEVAKVKDCESAGKTVTVPYGYRKYESCVVVEGIIDGLRFLEFSGSNQKLFGNVVPVVLNTANISSEQLNFVRGYNKILLGLDHDDAGRRSRDYIVSKLSDRGLLFDLIYPETRKDLGECSISDSVHIEAILSRGRRWKG